MKKRYEDGGQVEDPLGQTIRDALRRDKARERQEREAARALVDLPRFKAVRSGTGEVVTTEDGTPVLSAGYDDPETTAAYKEAARRSEETTRRARGLQMDQPFLPLRRSSTGLRRLLGRLLRTSEQQEEAEKKDKAFTDAYFSNGKKKGGSVTRGDGIAKRGKTRGRYI